MNIGEYGLSFNLGVGYDISAFTTLSLVFTRPDRLTFTRTNPDVTVPSVPITDGGITFAANQYVKYIFKDGDLSEAGSYTARLTYTDATKRLVSSVATFNVQP